MSSRFTDPIVEEVRRVRAELAARHGNDVAAIIRHAQALERTLDRTCVRYPPRRVVSRRQGACGSAEGAIVAQARPFRPRRLSVGRTGAVPIPPSIPL